MPQFPYLGDDNRIVIFLIETELISNVVLVEVYSKVIQLYIYNFFFSFRFFALMLVLFSLSVVSNSFAALWTAAHQASLFVGLPRQEYQSGLSFLSLGDLPDPRI